MKEIDVLEAVILFHCEIDRNLYDIGAITLEKEGRSFILDVVQSYTTVLNNATVISCSLEEDRELFSKCNFELTTSDILGTLDVATIFIGGEKVSIMPDQATLFVKYGTMIKAVDLSFEE